MSLPEPSDIWRPAFHVPSESDNTRGEDVSEFAELLMTASRGFKAGEPLAFTDWQRWLINRILETDPSTGLLKYRRALVGLPRKNGKSLLGTALALEHLVYGQEGAQVYSAAADRQQARIVFGEARDQVMRNPALLRVITPYRDALENKSTGGIYRALSADAMKAHGLAPSLVVADELHAWPSTPTNKRGDELYEALTTGSADRPESLVVAITTAGGNMDTLLGRLYTHGKRIATGEIDDPSFGFWWWEAGDAADPTDSETWRLANPNLAEGLMDYGDFESSIKEAGSSGFAGFQRYRLNQWVRLAGEDFISPFHWKEALRENATIPLGASVVAGFDGSVSGDATGLVICDLDTGLLQVEALFEPDTQDPEWTVDRYEVNKVIERMFDRYDVKMLWADPSFYEPDVLEWSKRWRKRVERIPPTNHRIAPMAQQFVADVVGKAIGHSGDPRLTRHVSNAVATESGSFRKEKKSSSRKVDLLACAVLANGARNHQLENAKTGTSRRAVVL